MCVVVWRKNALKDEIGCGVEPCSFCCRISEARNLESDLLSDLRYSFMILFFISSFLQVIICQKCVCITTWWKLRTVFAVTSRFQVKAG